MESNIKALRLSSGLTQRELAIQCHVSRHSVIRNEQLCYQSPLPTIVSTLSDILGTSENKIIEAYLADRSLNRAATAQNILFNHQRLEEIALSLAFEGVQALSANHPFQTWREWVLGEQTYPISRIYFSQVVSVHPATLYKYEAFKTGFPLPLSVAFKEMLLPPRLIELFNAPPFNSIR